MNHAAYKTRAVRRIAGVLALLLMSAAPVVAQGTVLPCPELNDPAVLIETLWPLVDTNGDGAISLPEALAFSPVDLDMFNMVDANGDGLVTKEEVAVFLPLLRSVGLLGYVDSSHDGLIQYAELAQYVTPQQFALVDKNGNGVIECFDLTLPTEGESEGGVDEGEPEGGIDEGEFPGDGELPVEGEPEGSQYCPLPNDFWLLVEYALPIVDLNADGGLSKEEIIAAYPPVVDLIADAGYSFDAVFSILDSNRDGKITIAEVKPIANAVVPDDFMGYIDPNRDGIIAYGEVSGYITQEQFDMLDDNDNGVLDCEDLPTGPEGELPFEGELPVEGETPLEGEIGFEGEYPGVEPCDVVAIAIDMFDALDLNRDGALTLDEIDLPVTIMDGSVTVYPGPSQVAQLFNDFDLNDDQTVTMDELEAWESQCNSGEIPCPLANDQETLLNVVWPIVDANGDDGLSLEELLVFSNAIDQSIFDMIDADRNGLLSREEILLSLPVIQTMTGFAPIDYLFMDADDNGVLSLIELHNYLPVTQVQFARADRNGNGVLDCDDILLPPDGPCKIPYDTQYILRWLWPFVDTNADDVIVLAEVQAIYADVTDDMFAIVDFDGNGELVPSDIDVLAQIAASVDVIGMIDANGDGLVQPDEVTGYIGLDLFGQLDANGNGVLDCEDIQITDPPTPPVVDPCSVVAIFLNLFAAMDANLDGVITLDELDWPGIISAADLLADPSGPLPDLLPFFMAFDLDGNRQISKQEVESVQAACNGDGEPELPEDPLPIARHLIEMFAIVDADGNQAVSLSELCMYFQVPPAVFVFMDTDGDGAITVAELEALINLDPPTEGESEEPLLTLNRMVQGNGCYAPGEVLTIDVLLEQTRVGVISALGLSETLPEGWTLAEVVQSNNAITVPEVGDSGTLQFAWANVPYFPAHVIYRVNVPDTATGIQMISGKAIFRTASSLELTSGVVETVIGQGMGAAYVHTADVNRDWTISLSEILRVIQFFNLDGYHCEEGTEDGFAPGVAESAQSCAPHGSDYMTQDWMIDLSELLRLIQLFNAPGRAYLYQAGTEDGFAPVLYARR